MDAQGSTMSTGLPAGEVLDQVLVDVELSQKRWRLFVVS